MLDLESVGWYWPQCWGLGAIRIPPGMVPVLVGLTARVGARLLFPHPSALSFRSSALCTSVGGPPPLGTSRDPAHNYTWLSSSRRPRVSAPQLPVDPSSAQQGHHSVAGPSSPVRGRLWTVFVIPAYFASVAYLCYF